MYDFKKIEEEILEFWEANQIFKKTLEKKSPKGDFVFYDGPPTANGRPAIHHFLGRTFKDIIPRFKTMQGYHVPRKGGWDTHGLPVEIEVEKELGFTNKEQIEAYGIAQFNQKAKESVWKYKTEWEEFTRRIGFWLDMDEPYITYDRNYIESLWWIISQFDKAGLLYKGHKVLPWCYRCGTALSSHEVAQGYKVVEDTSVFVKFKLKSGQRIGNWEVREDTFVLAWTTTPWTLPGNVALAVGAEIDYVTIASGEETFILSGDLKNLIPEGQIVDELKGQDLVGLEYQPLFEVAALKSDKSYKIYLADFVTTNEGTGVVHTAVMYGEDDYELGEKLGLPMFHTVDPQGKFTADVSELAGQGVKDPETEKKIITHLKDKGALFQVEQHEHEYPFCWRCKTPLLYYAKTSWFVAMSRLRKELQANNEKVNWIPEHLRLGRFGEFIKEAKDWAFSRERYWGTPLPIWECSECDKYKVMGSYAELLENSLGKTDLDKFLPDPHRPFVDEISVQCNCGRAMGRVSEVVDVWFDSGAMPYAQHHYPFENKEMVDGGEQFPADYIVEGIDQTRGWFYTLLAVATALGRGVPYKNVYSYNLVLDEKGKKMSKSVGNVIDPWTVIEAVGVDAIRWYFYTVNNPSEPKLFSLTDVQARLRGFLMTFWSSIRFLELYKRDGLVLDLEPGPQTELDRWLFSTLNSTLAGITSGLEAFDFLKASRLLEDFTVTNLSNWWIRRSRERFQRPQSETELKSVLSILNFVLLQTFKMMAPFTPFIAEAGYRKLRTAEMPESIHLESWPEVDRKKIDKEIEGEMAKVREIVAQGLALRKKEGIKVRQPLAQAQIKSTLSAELQESLKDELNIKGIKIEAGQAELIQLDLKITPALAREGYAREIIRKIQTLRRQAGYELDQRVQVFWESADVEITQTLSEFHPLIKEHTLLSALTQAGSEQFDVEEEFEVDSGKIIKLGLVKK
ncbi:MAG: isoleucine--tRNA ligase [Candidatus Yanofskybacteria bacterium CG10_big_fil_rev_8_21_14_0_10_46_23]|uniref:Isoleucine--tRNA ligase n=1 Tax=Candidatus Yanofskybacteria bacterium CG10_big_fil_rev_8_21_14_0_10_46_23 TaxID=1975098 RepID=A0A2H0R3Q3_9BACT|nr:MAG: isoleucine--tRNA ligase [Candidatus Yanofskybacteria bacterium CG10_big_fil_rev_8_21_14_0_10_46_23]